MVSPQFRLLFAAKSVPIRPDLQLNAFKRLWFPKCLAIRTAGKRDLEQKNLRLALYPQPLTGPNCQLSQRSKKTRSTLGFQTHFSSPCLMAVFQRLVVDALNVFFPSMYFSLIWKGTEELLGKCLYFPNNKWRLREFR